MRQKMSLAKTNSSHMTALLCPASSLIRINYTKYRFFLHSIDLYILYIRSIEYNHNHKYHVSSLILIHMKMQQAKRRHYIQ